MPIRRVAANFLTFFLHYSPKSEKIVFYTIFYTYFAAKRRKIIYTFFLHHFGEILNTLFFKNNRKIHRKQLLHSIFYILFAAKRRKFLHLFCYTLSPRSGEIFFTPFIFHFFCFKNENFGFVFTLFWWKILFLHSKKNP